MSVLLCQQPLMLEARSIPFLSKTRSLNQIYQISIIGKPYKEFICNNINTDKRRLRLRARRMHNLTRIYSRN